MYYRFKLSIRLKITPIAISVIFLLFFSSLTLSARATNSINILPPGGEPYGLTYEEHIENFWKWVLSLPSNVNPWTDETGQNCAIDQVGANSSVFYLGNNEGGESNRICKVQSGKALFIPISPVEINFKEAPAAKTIKDLQAIVKNDQDGLTSLTLTIDDKQYNLQDLKKYRMPAPSGEFDVVFPQNPVFVGSAGPGPTKAVADGYYVLTEPLSKGNHTIMFTSSLACLEADCPDPNFVQKIKYNIIAE